MNFGFIMTTAMYPLENKVTLKGCSFDNPRTLEEIRAVAKILRIANRINNVSFPETYKKFGKEVITLEMVVDRFFEKYSLDRKYLTKSNGEEYQDIYYKMAKNWIVLRYVENANNNNYSDDIYLHYQETIAYVNLLTFISFPDNVYKDHTFLIPESFDFFDIRTVDKRIRNVIISLLVLSTSSKQEDDINDFRFCSFDKIYNEFQKVESYIESLGKTDLIKFIADNINIYISIDNEKMRIISLVSILELLLTHNPDFNRFNVEDSIRKQFCNKMLILLYMNDKEINYSFLEKYLLKIYDLRSSIAHGVFEKIDIHLRKLHEILNENDIDYRNNCEEYDIEIILDEVDEFLRKCVRMAINTYLKEPEMLEILKK